jgi:DNA polymerase I-like protein with 3'-5' exonuclease and polymerase domains
VFEVPAAARSVKRFAALLRAGMADDVERELGLRVPLALSMAVGKSWGKMRPVLDPSVAAPPPTAQRG